MKANKIDRLISGLCCMPGIGPKSAQRIAYYLLERAKDSGLELAQALQEAITAIGHCKHCRALSETESCSICANPKRDSSILCVVETPIDIMAIENTNTYNGHYFVLMGHLSPLDGIGPKEIGIDTLQHRINQKDVKELILATNLTVEGEATAHYIVNLVTKNIKCSRIAHGVPMGGELEYTDGTTLARALAGRQLMQPIDAN